MSTQQLQSILSECQADPKTIVYLLRQGVEVEEIRLELLGNLHPDSLNTFSKIMQGERFLNLLVASGLTQ
jgi:hypothetical protein